MKAKLKKLICAGLACGATFYVMPGAEAASGDAVYNGHTYRVVDNNANWQQAKQTCAVMGGHLVTINSAGEQQFIQNLVQSKGRRNSYWLGGYRSGNTWRWVTGESFSYTHWGQWQPDNDGAALMMYRSNGNGWPLGAWNDLPENGGTPPFFGIQNMGFVCEWDSADETAKTSKPADSSNNDMAKRVEDKLWYLSQSVNGFRRQTKYTGSGQCRGFANKVYKELFGLSGLGGYNNNNYSAASYNGSHVVGYLHGNFKSNDTQAMKHLFQYAKPGSIVQMGRRWSLNSTKTAPNPHTVILYNVVNNGVHFYEANADGKNTIRVWFYSWADLAYKNKGFTIYEPNNYVLR